MPINFSPSNKPSRVSHIGFLMRSPMILLFRKYSILWMVIRKISATRAVLGEMVKATPVISVLLMMFPMMGSRPQRNVQATSTIG